MPAMRIGGSDVKAGTRFPPNFLEEEFDTYRSWDAPRGLGRSQPGRGSVHCL